MHRNKQGRSFQCRFQSYIEMSAFVFEDGNRYENLRPSQNPSGCAIAAVISKEGNKMSGEMIYNLWSRCTTVSNGLAAVSPVTAYILNIRNFTHYICFWLRATRKECEVLLKERFEIVKVRSFPHAPFMLSRMSRLYGDISSLHWNLFWQKYIYWWKRIRCSYRKWKSTPKWMALMFSPAVKHGYL